MYVRSVARLVQQQKTGKGGGRYENLNNLSPIFLYNIIMT
jgi:hypothetical protein